MKIQITLLRSLWIFSLVFCAGQLDADDAALEARLDILETKLRRIDAQLGKIDIIAENLSKLRNEDLPKIQRDLRGALPTSGRIDSDAVDGASEKSVLKQPGLSDVGDAAAGSGDPPLPTAEEPGFDDIFGGQADDGGAAGGVETRTRTLEQTVAAIEKRLEQLDTIAQHIDSVRNKDLALLQRDIRGLRETAARGSDVADGGGVPPEAETDAADASQEAVVIINNLTGVAHQVAINDVAHSIPPGTYRVTTTYGPLKTQLPQFTGPQTWEASRWKQVDGEYQMSFDLKP